ncbi:class III signal peptide-containing protein [Methanothermococcus sp.]|uniref:class III signal peptide-containing protein n=1 Tax=Methanothermococcus sp. TaxID=2614238 RepID=UPI0025F42281|nr:class III signal peptide-containing protein [Methanothermococcus sp.]
MKLLKKLTSKKGQVSMEIGILVAAAVAVAAIAAYYYATNVKNSASKAGGAANTTVGAMGNASQNYANKLSKI